MKKILDIEKRYNVTIHPKTVLEALRMGFDTTVIRDAQRQEHRIEHRFQNVDNLRTIWKKSAKTYDK